MPRPAPPLQGIRLYYGYHIFGLEVGPFPDDIPAIEDFLHEPRQAHQRPPPLLAQRLGALVTSEIAPGADLNGSLDVAIGAGVITSGERDQLWSAERTRLETIQVDVFDPDTYAGLL